MLFPTPTNIRKYFNSRREKEALPQLLSPDEVLAHLPLKKDFLPPRLIWHEEAVKRIAKIKTAFRLELEKFDAFKVLPSWAFYAALSGEAKTLNRLNESGLHVPLPWDERTNLPSAPTLSADAAKGVDFLEGKYLRMLLASFKEWTLFWEETIKCGHGPKNLKLRDVTYAVWVNHILSRDGDSILIKQFMCVRSDDEEHIKNHYSEYKPSQVLDRSNLVWTAANKITVSGADVRIEDLGVKAAKEVYDPQNLDRFQFGKRFMKIIKLAEAIF